VKDGEKRKVAPKSAFQMTNRLEFVKLSVEKEKAFKIAGQAFDCGEEGKRGGSGVAAS